MGHVIFSHGKESGPWGGKIRRLAETAQQLGYTLESLDYQGMPDPQQRAQHMLDHLEATPPADGIPLILAGSSMGAYVSLIAASRHPVAGLFLLAPALGLPEYAEPMIAPRATLTTVVHGWDDHLIDARTVFDWSRQHCCELHLVADGHRLLNTMEITNALFSNFLARINRCDTLNARDDQAKDASTPTGN